MDFSELSLKKNFQILDIQCGHKHTIILTNENKILSIGDNT